jgi:cytochrome c biogenesis protein CcdA/thiol-disulfide isomerase/thioredoxin
MILLIAFAFLAGAGTALSPCVLPILPAVLGAGVTGGRRRPLGIVVGLVLSFTFATVALVYVIDALGLPNDIQRTIAIAVLVVFGVSLLIPPLSDRFEAGISRIVARPPASRREGLGSGLAIGAGLGLAYAPCAGPILAGVITVSAAQELTAERLAVAFAYSLGTGVVLFALITGGRRLADRLRGIRGRVQVAIGVGMIAVAGLMSLQLDVRFQNAIAADLPGFLTNPTGGIEEDESVASEIAQVRDLAPHGGPPEAGAAAAERGEKLPVLFEAPEITGTQAWFNTDGEALTIDRLNAAGKVVLVDFWTYTCINCIRTLPYLKAWDERYRDDGLVILGVHTPEFPFEREAGNVRRAIDQNGISYPVVQDNEQRTWNAFRNQYWPAKYLIDAEGRVRYTHFGEGEYGTTEKAIRSLLRERGRQRRLGRLADARVERIQPGLGTPETYLGARRAQGWVNGPLVPGASDFGTVGDRIVKLLPPNGFAFQGRWRIGQDAATAGAGARVDLHFRAAKAFLVMGSPGRERRVEVLLDGEPVRSEVAGADVSGGEVVVGEQRLYRLIDLGKAERHVLSLEFEPGISGYAFTFG